MNINLITILTFIVVLVVLFWMMPNLKVETIGDFFAKLIIPISIALIGKSGLKQLIEKYKSDKS